MFEPDDAGGQHGAAARDIVRAQDGAGAQDGVPAQSAATVQNGAPAHGAADLEGIYRRAPVGALTIAGVATAIVLALWLAFYTWIFLPRSGS